MYFVCGPLPRRRRWRLDRHHRYRIFTGAASDVANRGHCGRCRRYATSWRWSGSEKLRASPVSPYAVKQGRKLREAVVHEEHYRICRRRDLPALPLFQHRRPHSGGNSLLRSTPGAARRRRPPAAYPAAEVLRPACAASDRQDLRTARAEGRAQRRRRVPLRLRQRRDRPVRPGGRGRGHASHARSDGLGGRVRFERPDPGEDGSRHPQGIRPARSSPRDAGPLVASRRQAAGAADRRDRHADRRHLAGGAAATARRLPGAAAALSPERDPVRGARRARLPDSVVR